MAKYINVYICQKYIKNLQDDIKLPIYIDNIAPLCIICQSANFKWVYVNATTYINILQWVLCTLYVLCNVYYHSYRRGGGASQLIHHLKQMYQIQFFFLFEPIRRGNVTLFVVP